MNTFEYANQALRQDLTAYARALEVIVTAIPQAHGLCGRIVKETRLIQSLLAFASGRQTTELAQIAMHLSNLWPYRERMYAHTLGFSDEITETKEKREEAIRGLRMLIRHTDDPLATEVSTCFNNIIGYLDEEQKLLEECHRHIQPHAQNMEITRKRLNLLIAAVDARMPESPTQQTALHAYTEAATILRDWETGVPMNEKGIDILARCLEVLEHAETIVAGQLNPMGYTG